MFILVSLVMVGCNSTPKSNYPDVVRKMHMESVRPHLEANGNEKYIELYGTHGCKELIQVIDELNIIPTIIERKKVVIHSDVNGEEFKFTWDSFSCPKDRLLNNEKTKI